MNRVGVVLACALCIGAFGCSTKSEPVLGEDKDAETAKPVERPKEDFGVAPTAGETAEASATSLATSSPSGKAEDLPPRRRALVFQAYASEDEGKLQQADVSKTFDDNASKLTGCVSTDTIVKVKLKVLPSGRVGEARVVDASPNEPKLRDCVAAVLRGLTFPRLKGNVPASVSMDLALKKDPS